MCWLAKGRSLNTNFSLDTRNLACQGDDVGEIYNDETVTYQYR